MSEFPISQLRLHKNSKALKEVNEGLKQSMEGKVQKRGSFASYIEDEQFSTQRSCKKAQRRKEGHSQI